MQIGKIYSVAFLVDSRVGCWAGALDFRLRGNDDSGERGVATDPFVHFALHASVADMHLKCSDFRLRRTTNRGADGFAQSPKGGEFRAAQACLACDNRRPKNHQEHSYEARTFASSS